MGFHDLSVQAMALDQELASHRHLVDPFSGGHAVAHPDHSPLHGNFYHLPACDHHTGLDCHHLWSLVCRQDDSQFRRVRLNDLFLLLSARIEWALS